MGWFSVIVTTLGYIIGYEYVNNKGVERSLNDGIVSSTQCVIIFYVYLFMIHYYVWSNLKINWKTKTFEHTVMFSWFNVFRITILNSIVYIPRIYDNKVTTLMHANTLVDISIIGCVQQYIFCFATLSIYVTSPNSSFNEKELFFIFDLWIRM